MGAFSVSDAGAPARFVAILAGGASARMGEAKATSELAGRPLISYPLAAAREAGLEPFVVAKRRSTLPVLDCALVIEPDQPRHPLTGIVAGLEHAADPIIVLACDAPLVTPELLAILANRPVAFAMPIHPRPQPLIARYTPSLLPALRAARDAGESMTSVTDSLGGERLKASELRETGDPGLMFANANRPDDLARIERLLPHCELEDFSRPG